MGWIEFGNGLGENNNGGIGMDWVKIEQNSLPDPKNRITRRLTY